MKIGDDRLAQQRFEKGTELHQMVNDYLKLLQQYWVVEESDTYWDSVMKAICDFNAKYKSVDEVFSVVMALAYLDLLEEKARQKRGLRGKLFERLESDTHGKN